MNEEEQLYFGLPWLEFEELVTEAYTIAYDTEE